jgi:UDP:flavonoid glycosyltransferase YjiC (YdhE family)
MMVMPLFWDQHDNAQRVQETGFGVRMATYTSSKLELFTAIDRLTSDPELRERLAAISERLQTNPGTVRAADLIERLAEEKQPILA